MKAKSKSSGTNGPSVEKATAAPINNLSSTIEETSAHKAPTSRPITGGYVVSGHEDFNVDLGLSAFVNEAATNPQMEVSYAKRKKEAAILYDPQNRMYQTYLNDTESSDSLTFSDLENLAIAPQNDLTKTLRIISICRWFVNKNDIIGLTAESIENNINTDFRMSFITPKKGVFTPKEVDQARILINDFNLKINLPKLITRCVTQTFIDGTFVACMRRVAHGDEFDYVVDFYPLGVAIISDYDVADDPYVLIDIARLRAALQKSYPKNKKKKGLFFDNMDEEVKANYPPEVYEAYKNKEQYAKLDIESTCVVRIGNQNRKYGLSPIFRALYPALMLEAFDDADRSNAKARAKKIIAQLMNKEILGEDYDRDTYEDQAYAHQSLLESWKQKTVVATLPPTVKAIQYVEPRVDMTNIETVNYYRQRVMSTLGISFLMDGAASASVANISLKQLMRRINRISKQLEYGLEKWYRAVLKDNGMNPALAPQISIIDSEMMDTSIKLDLVNALFGKLNCSYETAFETLGLSIEDEKARRERENNEKLEEVFAPRLTPYTVGNSYYGGYRTRQYTSRYGNGGYTSGNNLSGNWKNAGGGRPAAVDSNNPDKQAYDKELYQIKSGGDG